MKTEVWGNFWHNFEQGTRRYGKIDVFLKSIHHAILAPNRTIVNLPVQQPQTSCWINEYGRKAGT